MYKDIISYELAENITEERLFEITQEVFDTWMKDQVGFVKWEINTNDEGGYTDIVQWESKEHAKKAELTMMNMACASDWFGCYKDGSISTKNTLLKKEF